MKLNRKLTIPISILSLTVVAGSWLYKSGKLDKEPGWFKKDSKAAQEQSANPLYTCPMHPFIIKDRPGACPICGMDLVKKLNGSTSGNVMTAEQKQQAGVIEHVAVSAMQRVMANVATVEAREAVLNREINATGIVQYDQSRQARVTAWTAGRIDRLHVNTVGALVSKNRPVAEVYSPDLVAAQQEYLLALKSRDRLRGSSIPSISQNGDSLVQSARQRLLLLGVRESQIAGLEKGGKTNIRLPIYTPLNGVVIDKLVQQGQYVNVGDVLFNIADLSRVWVELDVYESDLAGLRVGQIVEIRSQAEPGRVYNGRISFINPFLDSRTRTVKARVELPNPGMRLKPEMFVNATVRMPLARGIVLPVTVLLDTGKRKVVWVESSEGVFEPRDVQAGQRSGDSVQILSGIRAGDKVAVTGAYLIDSESQLKGGSGQDHSQHGGTKPRPETGEQGPGTAGARHEGHTAPAQPGKPAPAKKDSLNMDDMKM